ncbi:MAG TPA: hypothetical protein VGJ26_16810 [Pirellulales bacterium]|jgi:hypothetical protein
MRSRAKIAGIMSLLALVVIVAIGGIVMLSTRHVPEFYAEAITAEPHEQRQASDELLQRATTLNNDLRKRGRWQALFTAEQINGWLSVDLTQKHPELLSEGFSEPRIQIRKGKATIACRYKSGVMNTVASATFELYLAEPDVLALRIDTVRAGALPMPMKNIVEGVAQAAERLNLRVAWRQEKGDPVALISLPAAHDETSVYKLDALELRDGELYIAGRTEPYSPSPTPRPLGEPIAERPEVNLNFQR